MNISEKSRKEQIQKPFSESGFGAFQDIKKVSVADEGGRVRGVRSRVTN